MTRKNLCWKTGGMLLISVLAALLISSIVFAEGEEPPEQPAESAEAPAAETEAAPPVEEALEAEVPLQEPLPEEPLSEEPPVEEEIVLEEPSVPTVESEEPPLEEPMAEEAEALAEADIMLADSSGEALDLASQESADAINLADPYFTVGTTTYRFFSGPGVCAAQYPGDPNCFDNQGANVIQDALNYIMNNGTIPTDRKVYVESGTYGVANVTVNGALPNMGSIKGLIGVNTTGTNPIITGKVEITQLGGGFTLMGFTINGQVHVHDAGGLLVLEDLKITNPTGDGVVVENYGGEVKLKNVDSSGNKGHGARIDNSSGSSPVSVTHSKFDDNNNLVAGQTFGLQVMSRGAITIDGVSASHNEGNGMQFMDYPGTLTIKNSVAVDNDYATSSYGFGIFVGTTTGKGRVLLENVLVHDSPDTSGIYIFTLGSVTVKNTISHNNLYNGLQVDNQSGTGYVKLINSDFYGNGGSGLYVRSSGNITLDSVRANDNSEAGAFLENCNWDGSLCLGSGSVLVTSPKSGGAMAVNRFSGNTFTGLSIHSSRSVTINNIMANSNGTYGINIDHSRSSSPVSVKVTLPVTDYENFVNEFVDNGRYGLLIFGGGAINVDRFHAESNTWDGLNLDNYSAIKSPGVVVSNGQSNANGWNGFVIDSKGAVSLKGVSASSHSSGIGVMIGGYFGAGNVSIKTTSADNSNFFNNNSYGVYVFNSGTIYIKGVNSSGNGSANAYLRNISATSAKSVTVLDSTFDTNASSSSLIINATGKVILSNVMAANSAVSGASIDNSAGVGTVEVSNSSFNHNASTGLNIYSFRPVTLNNVQANDNGYSGASIYNCNWDIDHCRGIGGVTVKAGSKYRNEFNNNVYQGLTIDSGGNVSVKNFSAQGNQDHGVSIYNSYTGYSGSITLGGYSKNPSEVSHNGQYWYNYGASLYSYGTVSVSQTVAEFNKGMGFYIDNSGAATNKPVNIKDSSARFNGDNGFHVSSLGNVTLSGIEASHNSIFEGTITTGSVREFLSWHSDFRPDKWWFNGSGVVTISLNSSSFDAYLELRDKNGSLLYSDNNSGGGTNAQITTGALALNDYVIFVKDAADALGGEYNVSVSIFGGSTGYYASGVSIYNASGTGNIIIKPNKQGVGVIANDNSTYGIYARSQGVISFSKVWASDNAGTNIYAYNYDPPEKNVTLSYAYSSNSGSHGIYITTRGNITLKYGYANDSTHYGGQISSSDSSVPRTVSISSFKFDDNRGWFGASIFAKGTVSLNGVSASRNTRSGASGLYVDNCAWDITDCSGTGDVILGGRNNEFSDNGGNGLDITTTGKVTLSNFASSNNAINGVNIYNNYAPGKIIIKNTIKKQFNQVNGNNGFGIYTDYLGTINVNRVHAAGNTQANMYLSNTNGTDPYSVSVSNSVVTGSVSSDGVAVISRGAITVNNVQAYGNKVIGIVITNNLSTDPQKVTIIKCRSDGNEQDGIRVTSKGDVELNTVSASFNSFNGVYIDNDQLFGKLTVKGSYGDNTFINNGAHGFFAWTGGEIYLDRIQSIANASSGIRLSHPFGKAGNFTGKRLTLLSNQQDGLNFSLYGEVYLEKVNVLGNGGAANYDGLYGITYGSGLTIKNSVFMGNTGSGIDSVLGGGTLTLTNVFYFGNDTNSTGDADLYNH